VKFKKAGQTKALSLPFYVQVQSPTVAA